MNPACMLSVVRSVEDYRAFRIQPSDRNRLVLLFDPSVTEHSLTVCIEIFEPGGGTPYHRHHRADEMFYILKGEGKLACDGKEIQLNAGDSVLVRPNGLHEIHNTGPGRLYALSIMVPNEDFAELVKSGTPAELDAEDWAVLKQQSSASAMRLPALAFA